MVNVKYMDPNWLSKMYSAMSVEEIAAYCQTYPAVIAICLYNFKIEIKENLDKYIK